MIISKSNNIGWADDITTKGRRHYYINAGSLCGKAKEKHYFRNFDKDNTGSKYSKDCCICIKKLKELNDN